MTAANPVRPIASSPDAPATAIHEPIPVQLNRAMNWPRMNARMRKDIMSMIDWLIIFTRSFIDRTVRTTKP